jgi:hypothetical protein
MTIWFKVAEYKQWIKDLLTGSLWGFGARERR